MGRSALGRGAVAHPTRAAGLTVVHDPAGDGSALGRPGPAGANARQSCPCGGAPQGSSLTTCCGPLLGGEALQFPAGMAFGAHALGFLRSGGRARLSTAGPWTRLDTPGGCVLGRPAMAV